MKSRKQATHEMRPEAAVTALVGTTRGEDVAFLRGVFDDANWTLYTATTVEQALIQMKRSALDLIIADRDVPDGGWRRLLEALKQVPVAPPLIVTARLADEYLWAEVLNEGGYDVLAQPFEHEEILRVTSAAARRHHNARLLAGYHTPLALSAGM